MEKANSLKNKKIMKSKISDSTHLYMSDILN